MLNRLFRMLRTLLWIISGALLVLFSVNNRGLVAVSLEPFITRVDVPLWALMLSGIFVGLLLAGLVTGGGRLKNFAKLRQAERRARELDVKASALAEDAHEAQAKLAHTAASDKGQLPS